MMNRNGTVWKTFIISVCIISVICIIVSAVYYNRSVAAMSEEIRRNNMTHATQLEENLDAKIKQMDRLAVGISVGVEVQLFFRSENPEEFLSGFYTHLKDMLVSYTYSNNDCVSDVMLYSPQYNRVMTRDIVLPYYPKDNQTADLNRNAEWVHQLENLETERTKLTFQIRSVNMSFPYVMTLVRQVKNDSGWGAVAVDIDLNKLYDAIWLDSDPTVSAWVLDGKGRVVVSKDKNSLYESRLDFPMLSAFENTGSDCSVLLKDQDEPVAYAQKYLEEYDLYVVTVTRLSSYRMELLSEQMTAVFLCILCAIAACLVVWLYTYFTSKPLNRILEMLRNPEQTSTKTEYSEAEVKEAAEFIVSYLQTNTALESELEKRLISLRKTQLQALKAQINPHFLFNTLNAIIVLIEDEVEDSEAAQVTMELADILHYSLSDEDLVVLEDEIKNSQRCVSILSKRYKDQFRAEFVVEPELMDARVPRLILQPLIENAVFHGISAKGGNCDGYLKVAVSQQQESRQHPLVRIDISDNGAGMSLEKVSELMSSLMNEKITMSHIGVQNVARKLKLLYPKSSRFEIVSEPGQGTTVSMIFPYTSENRKGGHL